MPRLRRKTPHEPVRAVPAPVERGAGALPPMREPTPPTLRSIALALNGGTPRPKSFDMAMPTLEYDAPTEPPAPFRERALNREGRAELLVFRIAGELFATELRAIEEAVEGVAAQSIPDAPPGMLGIFALRDRTLPLYVLARVLRLTHTSDGEMTLVMRPSLTRIAVSVDAVDDVFETALDAIRPAPTPDADGMVLGVVWRAHELVTLLDADVVVAACLADALPDSL
jgi:chemotaxis signal transduction protein